MPVSKKLSTRRKIITRVASTLLCSTMALGYAGAEPTVPPPIVTPLPSLLTLQNAIAIALREQPQQQIAQAGIDSALGSRQEATSQYYPAITPSYTYDNDRSSEYGITRSQFSTSTITPGSGTGSTGTGSGTGTGTTGTGTGTTTTLEETPGDAVNVIRGGGASISLKQTLIDSGQREETNAEARQQLESANFTNFDTREQIVANVTMNYYDVLEAIDLVKVAQAQVTENQQTVNLTQAEQKAGTAATTDVYQANANLATAQVTLIQDQNQVAVDTAALKNAMGIVTNDPLNLQSLETDNTQLPIAPTPAPLQTLDQYYQIAQHNRNDLKAQLAVAEEDRDAVKVARINAGLSLSADYLLTYQPDNDIGPKGTDSALTVTGTFPLADGGFSRGAVRIADATLRSQLATLEQTRQTILEAVEQDYATRQESLQAITYAQVAVQAGQINYNSAVASREAGVGTVLDITTAEATLTQAQSQYVTAIYNFYIADSNLQRAAGLD
jgi:outer membrane protein